VMKLRLLFESTRAVRSRRGCGPPAGVSVSEVLSRISVPSGHNSHTAGAASITATERLSMRRAYSPQEELMQSLRSLLGPILTTLALGCTSPTLFVGSDPSSNNPDAAGNDPSARGGSAGSGACASSDSSCPAYAPADRESCTLGCGQSALTCTYDCAHGQGYNSFATCNGQAWSVSRSLTACPAGGAGGANGGGSANTGGASAGTGGASANTGGASANTGGASANAGGGSANAGGGNAGDGGVCTAANAVCPTYAPGNQQSCTLGCGQSPLTCNYDCAHGQGYITFATCNGQDWSVNRSLAGCPVSEGGTNPTFTCGTDSCTVGESYCLTEHPGPVGLPPTSSCHAFDAGCTSTRDCSCFCAPDASPSCSVTTTQCRVDAVGAVYRDIYYP
jgi:hypothetical protein